MGNLKRKSKYGFARLNPYQIIEIKKLLEIKRLSKNKTFTLKEIGGLYNISVSTIGYIKNNKAWGSL